MSYTPINWQTGDVITAEKLNKMDNGWGVEDTQLFSETVTTVMDDTPYAMVELTYSAEINSDVLTVTFDGTEYSCARIDMFGGYFYGGFGQSGPDFSEYPFCIGTKNGNTLYTQNAGTYSVSASAQSVVVSDAFKTAINSAGTLPLLCVSGVTTADEMWAAWQSGRLLYFVYSNTMYIITHLDPSSTNTFMPTASLTITFPDGIFNVGII